MDRCLMRRVADRIELEPESFDQGLIGRGVRPSCDTPACVAGWAAFCGRAADGMTVWDRARRALGIRFSHAEVLFNEFWPGSWLAWAQSAAGPRGRHWPTGWFRPDAKQAVAVLRAMAADPRAPDSWFD